MTPESAHRHAMSISNDTVVRSLWIGRRLGPIEWLSMLSFLAAGHKYVLYTYAEVGPVPPGVTLEDAGLILPASQIFYHPSGKGKGSIAGFSDLFRYLLLDSLGGWWVDTDVVCLRRLPMGYGLMLASEHVSSGGCMPATAVMRVPAGHEILTNCIEYAAMIGKDVTSWGQTGPKLLSRAVSALHLESAILEPAAFCPVPHWDWEVFASNGEENVMQHLSQSTITVHLWHERWRQAGRNTRLQCSASSWLGLQMRRYLTGVRDGWLSGLDVSEGQVFSDDNS